MLTNTVERKTSARKEKLFGLMTRVNGRGRLIPTPAPDKTGYTEVAGGLGGPLLKTVHCIVKFNEPVTVTVTVCLPPLCHMQRRWQSAHY